MPRFTKDEQGRYREVRTGQFVSKEFVSHELSRVRFRFRGAEQYRDPRETGREYRTMKEVIDQVRDLDRFEDIQALEEEGIFGLIRKLSAEGRSDEY